MENIKNTEISFIEGVNGRILFKLYDFKNTRSVTLDYANIKEYETPKDKFIEEEYGVEIILNYVNDLISDLELAKKQLSDRVVELKSLKNIKIVAPSYFG